MKTKIKKDWFDRVKSIQELHNDSILWISEINFISDEMRFLEHLLSAKYIDCLSSGLTKKIEISVEKISDEKKVGKALFELILKQESVLSNLIETNSVTSNKNFLETHKNLEIEINNYVKKYKRIKKQIFNIIEKVMKKKEQKKLL